MGDKEGLAQRVESLLINPAAIQKIVISGSGISCEIPNAPSTQKSLQIYAAITSNRGWMTPADAERGLNIYGKELREETLRLQEQGSEKRHRNIELLEEIARSGVIVRSEIYRDPKAKLPPLEFDEIVEATTLQPTPFILYRGFGIRERAQKLNAAFAWVPGGFRNYFAIKSNDNPYIVEILKEEKAGLDCSSRKELLQAHKLGFRREEIILTANDVPAQEFKIARDIGAIINFDDITHIPFFQTHVGELPKLACCRFNPGAERVGNSIIGNPVESKYGMRRDQIFEAFRMLKKDGVERFGLHTMIASNERNEEYFVETGRMMFNLTGEIKRELGIEVEFVNLGGGIGTPYRPEHRDVDVNKIGQGIKIEYEKSIAAGAIRPDLKIFMENGRWLAGPEGVLVSNVIHVTDKYKKFVGLDANMASLPRPAIYDAYHHITVLGKEHAMPVQLYDVTGSLCENNDKFAVDRLLPIVDRGNIFVIHNSGGHSYVMGGNYNGKEKCAELLFEKGEFTLTRRAQTYGDMVSTFNFPGSRFAHLARIEE